MSVCYFQRLPSLFLTHTKAIYGVPQVSSFTAASAVNQQGARAGRGVAVSRTNHQPWSPTASDPRRRRHRAATTQHRKPGATGGERAPAGLSWKTKRAICLGARRESRCAERETGDAMPARASHPSLATSRPRPRPSRSATVRRWLPTFQSPPATCHAAPPPIRL
jgi:hypothetical protein